MERCEAVPLASALRLSTVESALGVTRLERTMNTHS